MLRVESLGLENIVAALLLIVTVTVGILVLYYWLSVYVQSSSTYIAQQAVIEHIQIVSLNITNSPTGTNVTVYVLNSGKFPVNIVLITIENATTGTVVDGCTRSLVGGVKIEPGQTKGISIVCKLASGTYIAKVVSERGTEASTAFTLR